MNPLLCGQQHFIRLHILHIQTLRKQCIWAEKASSISVTFKRISFFILSFFHSFFVTLWLC